MPSRVSRPRWTASARALGVSSRSTGTDERGHRGRKQDTRARSAASRRAHVNSRAATALNADYSSLTVMEFFSSVGGADSLRPSLFELIAQEQLRDLLQPALKYVLSVSAGFGLTRATTCSDSSVVSSLGLCTATSTILDTARQPT